MNGQKQENGKRPLRGLNPNLNTPNKKGNVEGINNNRPLQSASGNPLKRMKQDLFGGSNSIGPGNNSNNDATSSEMKSSNSTRDRNAENTSLGDSSDDIGKVTGKVGKKIAKGLIIKIIISIVCFFVFLAIFICVLCIPVFSLGIVDIGDISHMFDFASIGGNNSSSSSSGYVSTSDNTSYWWPIGSLETTIINGKEFATGTPSSLTITATFAGDDSTHNGAHGAVDIGAPVNGANVIATMDGVVIYPGENARIDYPNGWYNEQTHTCSSDGGGFGNYVKIDHGNGLVSIYGHMYANTITVREGDVVKQGQVIGRTGTSGCSTGGHLHFEFRLNGTKVDPLDYVSVSEPRKVVTNNVNNSTRTEMVE